MLNETATLKLILTGATGLVGEGVLLEVLEHSAVGQILMVSRRPSTLVHPKLKELLVRDFMHLGTSLPSLPATMPASTARASTPLV
jgi:hypothetical protein